MVPKNFDFFIPGVPDHPFHNFFEPLILDLYCTEILIDWVSSLLSCGMVCRVLGPIV